LYTYVRAYLAAWGTIKKTAQLQRVEKETKEEKESQNKAEKKEDKGLQLIHLKEKVKSKE
jgi:hypothetical protein